MSAGHLSLTVAPAEVRRGARLQALAMVRDPTEVKSRLEVGITCTETYDEQRSSGSASGGTGGGSHRVTLTDTAYQLWYPVAATAGQQEFVFEIPPLAPYSHDGDVLSYSWRAILVERRDFRIDPNCTLPFRVLP